MILESCSWSYNHSCEVSRRVISRSSELCRVESVASRMHRGCIEDASGTASRMHLGCIEDAVRTASMTAARPASRTASITASKTALKTASSTVQGRRQDLRVGSSGSVESGPWPDLGWGPEGLLWRLINECRE